MKKFLKNISIALVAIFSLCSCHDELNTEIKVLTQQVSDLEAQLNSINKEISNLSTIIEALESSDHIKNVSQISSGERNGYLITFTSNTSITILDGNNGITPVVGIRQNGEREYYYWTIQMGDKAATWMLDGNGNKVRASGTTPQIKIEDGIWWYSFDGKNWTKCIGWDTPQGDNGKSVFSRIDTSDPLYVIFLLADRKTQIKVPTEYGFNSLKSMCDSIQSDITSYTQMAQAVDTGCFVKEVSKIFDAGELVGYSFLMEDGRSFSIRNGRDNKEEIILGAKKSTDGMYYWTIRTSADGEATWLLYNGQMLPVSPVNKSAELGVKDSLGVIYFTVSYNGGPVDYMRDAKGNPVRATGQSGIGIFKEIDISDGSVVKLVLSDGTVVNLPRTKEYTPSMILEIPGYNEYFYPDKDYLIVVTVTDTTSKAFRKYEDYQKAVNQELTAIAVDNGYIQSCSFYNFSSSVIKDTGYQNITKYRVIFHTGNSDKWDITKSSRVAVFLTWGGNNSIMQYIERPNDIL